VRRQRERERPQAAGDIEDRCFRLDSVHIVEQPVMRFQNHTLGLALILNKSQEATKPSGNEW
jgi:hypothetical protein